MNRGRHSEEKRRRMCVSVTWRGFPWLNICGGRGEAIGRNTVGILRRAQYITCLAVGQKNLRFIWQVNMGLILFYEMIRNRLLAARGGLFAFIRYTAPFPFYIPGKSGPALPAPGVVLPLFVRIRNGVLRYSNRSGTRCFIRRRRISVAWETAAKTEFICAKLFPEFSPIIFY